MAVELQARRLPRQQPTLKTAFQLWYDALFVFKKKPDNLDRKSGHFQLRNRLFLTRHQDNVPLCLYWQKPYILDKIIFFLSLTKGASCLNLKSGGCCSRPLVFFFLMSNINEILCWRAYSCKRAVLMKDCNESTVTTSLSPRNFIFPLFASSFPCLSPWLPCPLSVPLFPLLFKQTSSSTLILHLQPLCSAT